MSLQQPPVPPGRKWTLRILILGIVVFYMIVPLIMSILTGVWIAFWGHALLGTFMILMGLGVRRIRKKR